MEREKARVHKGTKGGERTGIGHALIDDDDGDVELLGEAHEVAQVLPQLLLALGQLAAAGEFDAEERDDGVDDEHAERALVGVREERGNGLRCAGAVGGRGDGA